MAGLFLALWTPLVVLAPLAGSVVDRRDARDVLLVASLAQMAVAASLVLAVDSIGAMIALAALLGTGFAFAQPAEFALVPVVAGGQDLTRVNGLVETARYAGMGLGPVLGGVLAGLGGTEVAMLVNAGTFGVLVATLVQGAGLGLPTAWLVAVFAGAMWFIGGTGHGIKNTLARTLIQERVPDRLHGRAFAAYNAMRNGAELVALACGGVLVAVLGGRTTLALAGGVSVAVALVGLALYRRPAPAGRPEPELAG
jgi:predicted MFS family arabinose efflux permease